MYFVAAPNWAAISGNFSKLPSPLQGQPSKTFEAMRNIMAGPMRQYARLVLFYAGPAWAAIFWTLYGNMDGSNKKEKQK